MSFSSDTDEYLISEIGPFDDTKTNWLEYIYRMESGFYSLKVHDDKRKKYIFIEAIGAKILKIVKDVIRPKSLEDADVTFEYIIEAMEKHFYPVIDTVFYIAKFQSRKQGLLEKFFDYVGVLRKIMIKCRFPKKNQHSKLRSQLIAGVNEQIKAEINPNAMSLSQIFEVGLQYDNRFAGVRNNPRNHKARKNRVAKCFRCGQPKKIHLGQPCLFNWSSCSSCKVKGHLSLACKYKDMTCTNCNTKGHVSKLCKQPAVKTVTDKMQELSVTTEE